MTRHSFILSAASLLALVATSGMAVAQYTPGIAIDGRGPYTNTYIAPYYAPPYASTVPWPPATTFNPLLMTSINYPGTYGAYTVGLEAHSYRGPLQLTHLYGSLPMRMETSFRAVERSVGGTALVDVRVPADAELTFQGVRMTQLGTLRHFVTPPLDSDRDFGYDVRATWRENGQLVSQDRHVRVRAGDRLTIDFSEPATIERGTPPEPGGTSEMRTKPLK